MFEYIILVDFTNFKVSVIMYKPSWFETNIFLKKPKI